MKFYILLFLIILIPLTGAIQFSPSSLEFNLEKNEVSCLKVYFQIDYPTTLTDKWASTSSTPWSISNFNSPPSIHEISINYPLEINPSQDKTEICLSGNKPGKYRGAIIFRENEIENSIIQFAIWLKVNIEEDEKNQNQKSKIKKIVGDTTGIIWTSSSFNKDNSQNLILSQKILNLSQKKDKILLNPPPEKTIPQNIFPSEQLLALVFPIVLIILLLFIIIALR